MAYTPHGHYIRGSVDDEASPRKPAKCGGPGLCAKCSTYITQYYNKMQDNLEGSIPDPSMLKSNKSEIARRLVYLHVKALLKTSGNASISFSQEEVFVTWFCKTLQHWKALVGTTLNDNRYYEVTYNADKKEIYIDAYAKIHQTVIPDDVL